MNRRDRRADPPRWYKLDGYINKGSKQPLAVPEQYAQYVLGHVDDLVIVQIPETHSVVERLAFMEGFQQVAAMAGNEHKFVLVPASVQLLRLAPVDPNSAKELDRRLRVRAVEQSVREMKASVPAKDIVDGGEPRCAHGRPATQTCPHCAGIS